MDKADEMMVKRVAYYGINVSVPFIMMRHWDEWQQQGALTIDDTDFALCRLVMDAQYMCQKRFFGKNKASSMDAMLIRLTIVLSVLLVITTLALNLIR